MPTDPEELKKLQEEQAEMMKKAGGGGIASLFGESFSFSFHNSLLTT